ncbi:MAG: energy-coupling factor transporter ATPase [Clostridia bacterium]|nr:energy-coupling factor transporter ATPase [Clostridia bacterium]
MPIVVKDLSFAYSKGTPFEKKALDNINLTIKDGQFVGIMGHTGSGKSTFIQHINGLIKVQDGEITVDGIKLTPNKRPKPDYKKLRANVGMVFQYPEYQLFDETVIKDVAFGPRNLGLSKEESLTRAAEALRLVGLNPDEIGQRAPFELSGGQKRRVAIAGVIAMRPKILILDEPTAGLDPYGKEQIMSLVCKLKNECSPTVIVISHDMDEITRYAERLIIFDSGKVAFDVCMPELFTHGRQLEKIGLELPSCVRIADELSMHGIHLDGDIVNMDTLAVAVAKKALSLGIDCRIPDKVRWYGEEGEQ